MPSEKAILGRIKLFMGQQKIDADAPGAAEQDVTPEALPKPPDLIILPGADHKRVIQRDAKNEAGRTIRKSNYSDGYFGH